MVSLRFLLFSSVPQQPPTHRPRSHSLPATFPRVDRRLAVIAEQDDGDEEPLPVRSPRADTKHVSFELSACSAFLPCGGRGSLKKEQGGMEEKDGKRYRACG